METPERREARLLIQKIHDEHTLNGTITGTRFESLLHNCLDMYYPRGVYLLLLTDKSPRLASQLYEKSTHFLLEIIQNADDNTYDNLIPTLSFTYRPGTLRIDCNEIGFTEQNIEAICAVNKSTKAGKTGDGEYIGEKGIGFKSVFKAADVVWIASRDFTFKFDKTKFLGMVVPIWEEYPEPVGPDCTSILLHLAKDYEEETLIQELRTFDTNLLLFLRKLLRIEISLTYPDGRQWWNNISKVEHQSGAKRTVTLTDGNGNYEYLIRTHVIQELPREKKRPRWPYTKILLGFPIAVRTGSSSFVPQNLYASLPIRSFGLKFLVQGDFLLTASREDIESTLPWNRTIRDGIVQAFLQSIEHFNEDEEWKYLWPCYLPSATTATETFFGPAVCAILGALRDRCVLQSCANIMTKPTLLKNIAKGSYADDEGIPFTLTSGTKHRYLSPQYPQWALEAASAIGLTDLGPQEFLKDLAATIEENPSNFQSRPSAWHAQLSDALIKLSTDSALMSMIENINLIPLHDGQWTSAKGQTIFFARGESSLEIPSGIEVLVVNQAASQDPKRQRLFSALGVKAWEAPEICRSILQVHQSPQFEPENLSVQQLISHVAFLYKASWRPPKGTDLWFVTTRDKRCHGSKLYIPGSSDPNSAAARVFAQLEKKFPVIHGDYLTSLGSDLEWLGWLTSGLGLSRIPRLIVPQIEPKSQPIMMTLDDGRDANSNPGQRPTIRSPSPVPTTPLSQFDGILGNLDSQPGSLDGKTPRNSFETRFPPKGTFPIEISHVTGMESSLNQASMPKFVSNIHEPWYPPPSKSSNLALEGYQMQLMLLERQNKKRLMMLPSADKVPALQNHQTQLTLPEQQKKQLLMAPTIRFVAEKSRIEDAGDLQHADETPTLDPQSEADPIFKISEEIIYMFETCRSSDVLQIFRDNWHHYSQWIEGAHMQWQDREFLESSTRLKKHLASFKVQTFRDSLPMRDTVVPKVDLRLDERCSIPAMVLNDPASVGWAFLSNFGVSMKNDIQYYLRCLVALSQDNNPDIEDIAHIYEQIESRYQDHEALVSAAFYERKLVYVQLSSRTLSRPTVWMNMQECLSNHVDIEAEYPRSTYLFRCLVSPNGSPLAPLIASASLITSSTKLEYISRLFQDICAALKDINPANAARLLRPLRDKAIFPIKRVPVGHGYDSLCDMDDTSWYIADRPSIRESFIGKLPLLAFSIEELSQLKELFRLLRLENRILSSKVKSTMQVGGRISTHLAYTASLRSKVPFIKALIPHTHKDRAQIENRINGLRASISLRIMQTFVLRYLTLQLEGSSVRSQVALDVKNNSLNILMTRECAAATNPPHELATLIAENCGIKDSNHRALLYTTLCTSDLNILLTTFEQQGIFVKGVVINRKRSFQRGSSLRIPVFSERRNWMACSFRGSSEAMRFNGSRNYHDSYNLNNDRRLPVIHLVGGDDPAFDDLHLRRLVFEDVELDGWDHLQYLGELMVSKLLSTNLGPLYKPERDWTSQFRDRVGMAKLYGSASNAAFSLRDTNLVQGMTAFVTKFGKSEVADWKEKLGGDIIYHIDVFVRASGKTTSFALGSDQIERMRRFRLQQPMTGSASREVSVVISISDVYSADGMTVEVFVDAWSLFEANKLTLNNHWLLIGSMPECGDQNNPRKRRKLDAPVIRWADTRGPDSLHRGRVIQRMRTEYIHQALRPGQMRLLYLLPGASRDQLRGVIIHVNYTSAPLFRALSYVWGSEKRKKTLLTPDGVVPVTDSLSKALHALRQKTKPILIWCDAICINQEDHEEKVQQIRLLPRIFQRASSTYAYLDSTKNSDAAIEMLMQVRARAMIDEQIQQAINEDLSGVEPDESTQAENTAVSGRDAMSDDDDTYSQASSTTETIANKWPLHLRPIPDAWRESITPRPDDRIWSDVENFFNSAWFRRAWIIQEIVATPQVKIVCGKWIIDWHDLHQAMEIVDRELEFPHVDGPDIKLSWKPFLALAAQRDWEAEQCRWTLITLLENFRFAQSTLYRDRFFALLGLASDGNDKGFEPDYESLLEHVLLRFARIFVGQGRGLQLLYRAGLKPESHRFPSWIPDWITERPQCLYENGDSGISFAASGPQNAVIACIPDSDELSAAGYVVDGITHISSSCNKSDEWSDFFREIDEMIESATLCRMRTSHADLKWKVPIAGALHPTISVADGLGLEASYSAFRDYLKSTTSPTAKVIADSGAAQSAHSQMYSMLLRQMNIDTARQRSSSYIAALGGILEGWRFVITKRGYAGMVPNLAKQGDIVSIIKGGQVPFVLRESGQRVGSFRLVGESYIHGIMNGEALALDGVEQDILRIH